MPRLVWEQSPNKQRQVSQRLKHFSRGLIYKYTALLFYVSQTHTSGWAFPRKQRRGDTGLPHKYQTKNALVLLPPNPVGQLEPITWCDVPRPYIGQVPDLNVGLFFDSACLKASFTPFFGTSDCYAFKCPPLFCRCFLLDRQWLWQFANPSQNDFCFHVGFAGSPSCPESSQWVRIRTNVNMREKSSSLVYYEICVIYPTCVLLLPDSDPAAKRQWAKHLASELGSRIYLHAFRRHAHRTFTDRLIYIEHRNVKKCVTLHYAMLFRNASWNYAVPVVYMVEWR